MVGGGMKSLSDSGMDPLSRNDGGDTGWTKTDSRGLDGCETWESNPNLEPFVTGQSFRVALKTKRKEPKAHVQIYPQSLN